jgi:Na+-transporting methylmalonyl-CoA/oxaloacetate decarboxylase gamma subunit
LTSSGFFDFEEKWMRVFRGVAVFCVLLFAMRGLVAQQNESAEASKPAEKTAEKSAKPPAEAEKAAAIKQEPPVVTHHEIHVGGRTLHYTATTGYMEQKLRPTSSSWPTPSITPGDQGQCP